MLMEAPQVAGAGVQGIGRNERDGHVAIVEGKPVTKGEVLLPCQ
jgi:hypothetical protein